jgi:hypothetical protein
MKDRQYYLDRAANLRLGVEMEVAVCEDDGGLIRRVGEDSFECYQSTGYGSNIFNYGTKTFDELGAFIDEAMSWT